MPGLLLLVCLLATTGGAIAGFGGGSVIKPVLDALDILPSATISFCSGCTVLAMSISSLLRTKGNGVGLQLQTSTPLALGAVLGGLVGKWFFQLILELSGQDDFLGGVQSICLTIITAGVLLYILNKSRLPSRRVEAFPAIVMIGLLLGVMSAFLGIGGGTTNMVVLFYFFSMEAKQAAKNSIYIIMFSQTSSILIAIVTETVPDFSWFNLAVMMLGGVTGAILGAAISRRLNSRMVERLLLVFLVGTLGLNIYNVVQFMAL